jgi:hypothetical protein
MGAAAKLSLGILFLWLAMVAFYFAFHPNGVSGVTNPATALQWLMAEFNKATGSGDSSGPATGTSSSTGPQNAGAAPGGA